MGAGFFGGGVLGPARQTTPLPETATASPDEPPSTDAYAQLSAGAANGAAAAAALGAPHSQAVASTAMTRVTRADPERLVRCTTKILGSGGTRHAGADPEWPDGGAREHSGLRACAGPPPQPVSHGARLCRTRRNLPAH